MILVPGKGKDVLVDLINQQNVLPSPLTPDDVFFTTPKYVQGNLPTLVQSSVIAAPGSVYEGAVPVQYERMDLTSAFGDIVPKISGLSSGNLWSMLPYISNELGIQFNQEDFAQVDYSWLGDNEQVNIPLVALTSSMGYVGSFHVQFTRRRMQLTEALKVTDIQVLHHPGWKITRPTKKLVDLKTWSTDFTEFRDVLTINPYYGIISNGTKMRAMMADLGFANWPVGIYNGVKKQLTSKLPQANQDYEWVITQRVEDIINIQTLPYAGTAYFHFNNIDS